MPCIVASVSRRCRSLARLNITVSQTDLLNSNKLTLASENLLRYPVHHVHVVVDEKAQVGRCQIPGCLHASIAQEAEQPGVPNAPLALLLGFLLRFVLALVLLSLSGPV